MILRPRHPVLRRSLLTGALATLVAPGLARAAADDAGLIDAAKKEGKVVWYTSIDLQVAEKIGKAFEAAYPGIGAQVERNGAERNFQRLGQERGSQIYAADVIESSDITHFIVWKRQGWLDAFLPAEVTAKWPAAQRDPDGHFATVRFTLCPLGYNSKEVAEADAPKSYADLLDPKWAGKIVKAHPGYSGTIMTATYELSQALGWDYFQKLARQKIMQVQSATEPPKILLRGERPVMADGVEYLILAFKDRGDPVAPVYASEGTPSIPGGAGLLNNAPHPHAGRLLLSYLFSREGQQMLADLNAMRSFHPDVKPAAGMRPLSEIKLLTADPAAQERAVDQVKQKYSEIFGI